MFNRPTREETIYLEAEDRLVAMTAAQKAEILCELSDAQLGSIFNFLVNTLTDWNPKADDASEWNEVAVRGVMGYIRNNMAADVEREMDEEDSRPVDQATALGI